MNSAKQTATNSPGNPQVTTAFLLGWSLSQVLGLVRKGTRPPSQSAPISPDYAPRLVVSGGSIEKSTDALMVGVERIVQFYLALGLESRDKPTPLTEAILALPEAVRAWLTGVAPTFYSQHDLRELLNNWSLQVWARLEGESEKCAQAFTAGMSLADTYWYLRLPSRRPEQVLSEENWRRLLSKYRLEAERARLKNLESDLPPYVVAVLRQQLKNWSIGTILGYQSDRLVPIRDSEQEVRLKPGDESALQRALARQVRNWESLVFGLRAPVSYLHAWDRRWIAILRWSGLFLALLGTALLLLVVIAVSAFFIAAGPLPGLLRFLTENRAGVSEYLAVVSLLWTILIAAPVPIALRAAYQGTRGIQQSLDDALTTWFITRRTYIPWNEYLKEEQGTGA